MINNNADRVQEITSNLFKKYRIEFIFFFVLFSIKIFIFFQMKTLITNDSNEYIGMNGFSFFRGQIDEYRLPLYPLLIEIFERFSPKFSLQMVTGIQLLISCLASVYFYRMCNIISNKKAVNLLFTFLYTLSYATYMWEKTILTESFGLSVTVFFLYYLVRYMYYQNFKNIVKCWIFIAIGVFFKPTFLLFYCILLIFLLGKLILNNNQRLKTLKALLVAIPLGAAIFCYATAFQNNYGVFSFSNTYLRQQLIVINGNTNLYTYMPDSKIKNFITKMNEQEGEANFATAQKIIDTAYEQNISKEHLNQFISETKAKSRRQYVKYLLKSITNEANISFMSYATGKSDRINKFLVLVPRILKIDFLQGLFISIISLLLFFYRLLAKKKASLGTFGFIFANYYFAIVGTNGEIMRTTILSVPFIYLSLYLFVNDLIDCIKSSRNSWLVG